MLTIFVGAGIGHLYLRKFLKAAVLIGINLVLGLTIILQMDMDTLLKSPSPSTALLEFMQTHKNRLLYHDIILAAVWAYALMDVWKLTGKQKTDDR